MESGSCPYGGGVGAAIEPYASFDFYRPRSVIDQVIDPYPQADAVLATLDGVHDFEDIDKDKRWELRTHCSNWEPRSVPWCAPSVTCWKRIAARSF